MILGFDPGLACTGFGAVYSLNHELALVKKGTIRTSNRNSLPTRLRELYTGVTSILDELKPDLAAMEDIFSSVRYPKAGLLLGEVAGVILLAAEMRKVPIFEIPTREVKSSLTGNGSAKKEQVREVVNSILKLKDTRSHHEADALACALVLHYRGPMRLKNDIVSVWKTKIRK